MLKERSVFVRYKFEGLRVEKNLQYEQQRIRGGESLHEACANKKRDSAMHFMAQMTLTMMMMIGPKQVRGESGQE